MVITGASPDAAPCPMAEAGPDARGRLAGAHRPGHGTRRRGDEPARDGRPVANRRLGVTPGNLR